MGFFWVFIKKAKYCKVIVNYVSAELRFKCNSTVITSLIQILFDMKLENPSDIKV